ncbi:MAG: tRNA (adenosine(37)-N6)-dimethylallyltransferase MiaA [Litorimonas sp.]
MKRLELDRPVVCIAGPTASGKSDYALDVAKAVGGEIVNADALQVYTDLTVLSARPTEAEMEGIPHHLFGHVAGGTAYSTGQWLREVAPVLEDIDRRGRVAVLVGGTGLYFQSLFKGLADIPEVPDSLQSQLDAQAICELRAEAERVDPVAAARVLGDDPQRLARIVGVHKATGRALSAWQAETHPVITPDRAHRAVLLPDRAALYDRINRRFDHMVEAGGLDEARRVADRDYPIRSPILKAIGLSHLLRHLDGELDLDRAVELAKRDTRRFAKRQMSWFRNRCADWDVLETPADRARFVDAL